MPITTADFADKKAYQKALVATLKASAKGLFYYYDSKYDDGNKAKLLVFGPNVAELKKHLESKKATLLDEGPIGPGAVFAGKRGKLDAKGLEALGIADLASTGGEDGDDDGDKKTVDVNTIVPGLARPVRVVLAEVIAYGKEAATIQHPKLKANAGKRVDTLIDRLKKGKLTGFSTEMVALQQTISDAKVAPVILAELMQIEPVAKAHKDPKAKPLYDTAKKLYDDGDLVNTRGFITQFNARYGNDPYSAKGIDDDAKAATAVAKVGTLAGAYEAAKAEVERKVAKALGDRKKWATYVPEADVLKDFFAKNATLGLRKQIESIEAEADKAKRKKLVEKAIVSVQSYITEGTRALEARNAPTALSIEYFRLLRHLHSELGKLHH